MSKEIKVLIIDDSALMRTMISKALNSADEIEVIGTALNGKFGLDKMQMYDPDVIITDLEMPELNGIEFLKEKNKLNNKTPVIILSALAKKGAQITLEALSLGASDFILKPGMDNQDINITLSKLIEIVKVLAASTPKKENKEKNKTFPKYVHNIENLTVQKNEYLNYDHYTQPIYEFPDIHIVSIGISTGGPNALRQILPIFPRDFPVPIVIVQHMPPGFTYEFANNLKKICQLEVKEAENNDILMPGRIFIAPGSNHVTFDRKKLANVIELFDGPPVNSHKPSADVLFKSTAEIFGRNSLGCIMTGMGKDGADNIGLILRSGGITIAQDEDSSIVFGMPKIAIKNKNINLVRNLNKIAETIINLVVHKRI